MLTARKLVLGRSLQQLRQAWIDAGQTARSRITGAIRPGLPPDGELSLPLEGYRIQS